MPGHEESRPSGRQTRMGGREKEIIYNIPNRRKKSMLTTRTLSALLRWARNNVDEPLEEVRTAGDTLWLQLRDGRTGVLYLEDGEPRLVLPAEI